MDDRNAVHIVSHTHWDREWYLTQEQYRLRLADLIDHAIDLLDAEPDFAHFHLDAQTIVLDDYAAVRPSRMPALTRLIREGRILVGPWYEQNDLYLTSGESTVRNLMEGIRAARELGGEMRVGYLPDHFGLISQMPQILRLVGIDNAIFGRGFDARRNGFSRFRWAAPDGSVILAVHMSFWYNNAQRFPDGTQELRSLFEKIMEREQGLNQDGPWLLMNGVDHLEAQENLVPILQQLRSDHGGRYDIRHSTMPAYVGALRRSATDEKLPQVDGELREGESYSILNGTLSARVYLKQANDVCGDLVERWLEPLSVWCAMASLERVDREYMRFLWKLFMENHPHDSICGCSQDAVHEHMMDRYERVTEMAEGLIDRKLNLMATQVDAAGYDPGDLKLMVANMSPLAIGTDADAVALAATASVSFLSDDEVRDFELFAPDGTSVPYRVTTEEECRTLVLSPINLPGVIRVRRVEIEFAPSVPAYGYTVYRIVRHAKGARVAARPAALLAGLPTPPVLENDHLRVELRPNGRFDLTDRTSGKRYEEAGTFLDGVDEGDLYVSVPLGPERVWDGPVEFVPVEDTGLAQECRYRFTWQMPEDLAAARDDRGGGKCDIAVSLKLDRGARALCVTVTVDNDARDHRLRLAFPAAGTDLVRAGGQFDVAERAPAAGRTWTRSANGQPFWKWVAACNGEDGLAVYAVGLHEYEMTDDDSALAVTLLRAVETVNVREAIPLETDRQVLAQCPGRHRFTFAVRPFDGLPAARLTAEAELFHMGIRTKQTPVEDPRWFQGRSWVQDSAAEGAFRRPDPNAARPRWPRSGCLLKTDGPVHVSAIKWHEREEAAVVRLVNLGSNAARAGIAFSVPLERAWLTNLLEEELSDAQIDQHGVISVEAARRQIVTVAAEAAASE